MTGTIRYKGDGTEFHAFIPARDLDAAEYQALDADRRALVRASPLYDYAAFHDAAPQRAVKDAPAEEAKAARK